MSNQYSLTTTKAMNTSALKNTIVKELAIVLICVLIGLAGTAFAAPKGKEHHKKHKHTALNADELKLLAQLDSEFQVTVNELEKTLKGEDVGFDRVEVYDMAGNLLKTVENSGKPFSDALLPIKATYMMTEDRVAYYIVL
jgi:hypothetical protein